MQQLTPSPQLYKDIVSRIRYEQELNALKTRLYLHGTVFFVSLTAFSMAFITLWKEISSSSFFQLLSLATSDFNIILSHLTEYLMSLLNSLPILTTALASLMLLGILFSFIKLARDIFAVKKLRVN